MRPSLKRYKSTFLELFDRNFKFLNKEEIIFQTGISTFFFFSFFFFIFSFFVMDIKLPARLKQLKDSVQEFLDQDSCSDRVDGPQSAKGAENG